MSLTNYNIFSFQRTVLTWKNVADGIERNTFLDSDTRALGLEVIRFFQSELGKGFFDTCGQDHPLYIRLGNCTPRQIIELKEWMETLKWLKDNGGNYAYLLKKLRGNKSCKEEGFSFLEITNLFFKRGFKVKFPAEIQNQKNPDIEAYDPETGETLYIEVAQINVRESTKKSSQYFFKIGDALFKYGFELPHSLQLLAPIDSFIVDDIINKIKDTCEEVRNNQSLGIYQDDNVHFAIAHPTQNEELEKWCIKNGRSKGASGLPVGFNETPRITSGGRIHHEARHFTKEQTGILIMPVDFLYFFTMNRVETIISFKEYLINYPNIQGLVIYCTLGQPYQNELIEIPEYGDLLNVKTKNDTTIHLLYVTNPGCQGSLSERTLNKFREVLLL